MTDGKEKGRRAAERRRERDGSPALAPDGSTSPGLPHEEHHEVSDSREHPLLSGEAAPLPGTQAGRRHSGPRSAHANAESSTGDPEASFVRELRQSKDDGSRALSAEHTSVRDGPSRKKKAKGAAKLVVIEGGEAGKELPITLTPTLVGRTAKADVQLAEPTVSLRHLEIAKSGRTSFTLFDLGSTSGTLVNGVAVNGEVELAHGDIVSLGKMELRFLRADGEINERPLEQIREATQVDSGVLSTREGTAQHTGTRTRHTQLTGVKSPQQVAQESADARKQKVRKAAIAVIVGSVVTLAAVVGGRALITHAFSDEAPAQIRAQVAELLADGRRKLMDQDVDGAYNAAQTVLALDKDNADAASLEKMARTEKEARDAIELALRLGDEERDVEAEQILKRVPDASVFAPARDRLRRSLADRGQIRSRRVIEALLDRGEAKAALLAATTHMQLFPKDDEAKGLLARAQEAVASQPRDPMLTRARSQFAAGDVAGARATALEGGYRSYVADLDRFSAALDKGKSALKQTLDGAAALPSLDEAYRLVSSLGGSPQAAIMQDVKKPYANALYLSGTERLDRKDKCGAARDLFKAARVMPEDGKIASKVRELEDEAEQGLVKARAAKTQDTERAAAIAREALCLARTGTKTQDELKQIARF